MNRVDRRVNLRRLEKAHLELGRAYEHLMQLHMSGSGGTPRMREAQNRLHKAESRLLVVRGEMRLQEQENKAS